MPIYRTNILPVGKFYHNKFGEIEITKEAIQNMESNFRKGIPHYKLSVNKQHNDLEGAFGEIQNVIASDDGLHAEINVDEEVYKQLGSKRFKYHSAEYADDYLDKKTGKKVGATLLGVALTNTPAHPFVPEIQLSEDGNKIFLSNVEIQNNNNEGVETMSEATNIKLTESKEYQEMVLKLSEAQSEVKKLSEQHKEEMRKLAEEKQNEIKKLTEEKANVEKQLSEIQDANYKLEVEAWQRDAIAKGKAPAGVEKLAKKLSERAITKELANEMLDVVPTVPLDRVVTTEGAPTMLSEIEQARKMAKLAWGVDVK